MLKRGYQNGDSDKIMEFLKSIHRMTGTQHSWLPARYEYAEYLCEPLFTEIGRNNWKETFQIWEENGEIKAVILSEINDDEVFILIHPDYRGLEEEMITWAEENLAFPQEDGTRKLTMWAYEDDESRKDIYRRHGFKPYHEVEYIKSQNLEDKVFQPVLPEGYRFSSVTDDLIRTRIECSAAAFSGEPFSTETYHAMQKAPSFLEDLDLVILDPEGEAAAFCTVWYYPDEGHGVFEPVGTHPDHQRKGLAKAIIFEGLRRAQVHGAKKAYVNAFADHRSKFYASAGFEDDAVNRPWIKTV